MPDAPDAFTLNQGWNLAVDRDRLIPIIQRLKDLGIRISLFMDADSTQMPSPLILYWSELGAWSGLLKKGVVNPDLV